MAEQKLKPCPFCGDSCVKVDISLVACPNETCPIHSIFFTITAWETRTENPLLEALEYAENFIDSYGEACLKENLGRDGMDAVLKQIKAIRAGG